MGCDICGHEAAPVRKVTETCGKGKDLPVIENILMVSCPKCGDSYFSADTLHEIERSKPHRHSFAARRPIEVANFV